MGKSGTYVKFEFLLRRGRGERYKMLRKTGWYIEAAETTRFEGCHKDAGKIRWVSGALEK